MLDNWQIFLTDLRYWLEAGTFLAYGRGCFYTIKAEPEFNRGVLVLTSADWSLTVVHHRTLSRELINR